jgi:hypothetical protein
MSNLSVLGNRTLSFFELEALALDAPVDVAAALCPLPSR